MLEIRRHAGGVLVIQQGVWGETVSTILTGEQAVQVGNMLIMEAARLHFLTEQKATPTEAPEPDGERFSLLEMDDTEPTLELDTEPFRLQEV